MADNLSEAEKEALRSEVAKLGERGVQRVEAAELFLRAQGAENIIGGLRTAAQVESVERLMASFRQQRSAAASTIAPGSQQHREPPREPSNEPGRWTEEQYQKASARERLDYVRQFPQPTDSAGR